MKPSTHPYVQFPSNRSHKVLWHVLQRSTQSNPWSPSALSVKYDTVHMMNIIENYIKKEQIKKRESAKQEDKEQYEPLTVCFNQGF